MNKTIQINLAEIIFYIDEDAFEKLKAYLASLKDSLGNTVGKEEIIADIEARMAELFQAELKRRGKKSISSDAVDGITDTLGQPEDYVDEEAVQVENTRHRVRTILELRKLYRDPDRKVIAGVASGLAAYLGIHPLWMRISFIALSFLTLGSALAIYGLLWISFPYAKTSSEKLKMRGEPVNFNTIKKTFTSTGDRAETQANQTPTFFERLATGIGRFLLFTFKAIGYFILFLLLWVAAMAIGTLVLLAFGVFGVTNLHILSWDLSFLLHHIPFAIASLIVLLLIGGLILSIAGVAIGKKTADFLIRLSLLSLFILVIFAVVRLWHIWYWIP